METAIYNLKSVCPLVQHNGELADPLNEWAKSRTNLTGKRNKTDADHEEIGRIE